MLKSRIPQDLWAAYLVTISSFSWTYQLERQLLIAIWSKNFSLKALKGFIVDIAICRVLHELEEVKRYLSGVGHVIKDPRGHRGFVCRR
jgi:hypothetical protein